MTAVKPTDDAVILKLRELFPHLKLVQWKDGLTVIEKKRVHFKYAGMAPEQQLDTLKRYINSYFPPKV